MPKNPSAAKKVASKTETQTGVAPESRSYHVAVVAQVAGEKIYRDVQANFGVDIDSSTIQGVRAAIAGQLGVDAKVLTIISWQPIATPTPPVE